MIAYESAVRVMTGLDIKSQLTHGHIQYRLDALGVTLNHDEARTVCDRIAFKGSEYHDTSMLDEATVEELTKSIDTALEIEGFLDGPGDCPECGRNGTIASHKHAKCLAAIFSSTNGRCDYCDARATNTRHWRPVCQGCAEHQDLLDI